MGQAPSGLAIQGSTIYFTVPNCSGGMLTAPGTIESVPMGGGTASTLATLPSAAPGPVVATPTQLYWIESDCQNMGWVYSSSLDGGSMTPMSNNVGASQGALVMDDGGSLYFCGDGAHALVSIPGAVPYNLVNMEGVAGSSQTSPSVAGGQVVWLWLSAASGGYPDGGLIASIAADASLGQPVAVATGQNLIGGSVLTDGVNAYWINVAAGGPNGEDIDYAPVSGGGPISTLVHGITVGGPGFLTMDACNLYYFDNYQRFWGVPLTGGSPVEIGHLTSGMPGVMLLYGTTLYFSDSQLHALRAISW